MSTKTEKKAANEPDAGPQIIDEQTGVYGWFRRHQKKLLYSVGMFVLVLFSVSGPMLAMVREMFAPAREMPTIQVGGQRVPLEPVDYDIGTAIANRVRALQSVLPILNVGESGRSEAAEVYAWLRRAAITEGIDVSYIEVDRAIAAMMERGSVQTATQLARQYSFGSLADFESIVAEALRIGTLLHLQTLALDNSEARILEKVIGEREKVGFRVATFDEAGRSDELKEAAEMSEEDLRAWLDEKEDIDKKRLGVFDTNKVALNISALMFTDFDRAEWEEDELKDFVVGDEERLAIYEQNKIRFEHEDGTKPVDDEDVIAELNAMLDTQKVLQGIIAKINERRTEWVKDVTDELRRSNEDVLAATNQKTEAENAVQDKPDDENLKKVLMEAETKFTAMENAQKTAQEASDARYAAFDFTGAVKELAKDRKGFVQRSFSELRKAKELEDLDGEELGLGKWDQPVVATYLARKGDFSFAPAWTDKAAIIYQASDVEVQPLKEWEELGPLLEGAYFSEKAKEEADEKKQKLEDALLRLAKAKLGDKVTQIEGKRQERIDEKVAEWEAETKAGLDEADAKLATMRPGTQVYIAWEKRRDALNARLEAKDTRVEEISKEIDDTIESEIGELATEFHAEVLDEAAAEAGFTVTDVGPLPRDLSSKPRFDKKFDKTTVFLFRSHSEMDEGDSTGVVNDAIERRWHVAVCTGVEDLSTEDVERREFELVRKGWFQSFAGDQAFHAFNQAFTKEALEKRYDVKRPQGEQTMPESGDTTGGENPTPGEDDPKPGENDPKPNENGK